MSRDSLENPAAVLKSSVVLATWNGERFIERQLQSLAEQTRPPDELIVCDDRSSDRTVSLAREFASRASFPVHLQVNPENIGLQRNFAQAMSMATGDVLIPCDQDDVWHDQKLARFMELFERDARVGLVFGDANVVNEDLTPRGYTAWDTVHFTDELQQRVQNGEAFDVLLKHCFIAAALMAIRAPLRSLALPLPESWPFDAWVAMLAAASTRTRIVIEPVNDYRQHHAQAIGTSRKGILQRYREARGVTVEYYQNKARAHRDLRDRLLERHALEPTDERIQKLDRKITFAEARVQMRRSRWRRVPLIAREWRAGNYQVFGQGVRSLAMDLFV